jgi:hypothetical protein
MLVGHPELGRNERSAKNRFWLVAQRLLAELRAGTRHSEKG